MNIYEISITPPEKSTCHLPSGLINAIMVAQDSFCAQDVSVVGFMSGGMVIDTVSEGFCNYLRAVKIVLKTPLKDEIDAFKML